MEILLVNNNTKHLSSVQKSLAGHRLEVQKYRPGLDFHFEGKDLIILSGGGGEGREANDAHANGRLWYEDEMQFILSCKKPIIGICMGFEVIARAYGANVPEMDKLTSDWQDVSLTKRGKATLGQTRLRQLEAHRWHVPYIPSTQFETLADSATGIEIIRHKSRPIMATQFHPEVDGGTLSLSQLIKQTLTLQKSLA